MPLASDIMKGGVSAVSAIAMGGQVNRDVVAAGSTQSDATLLQASNNIVASADGTKGVRLPAVQIGRAHV